MDNMAALVQIMAWCQSIIWTNDGIIYWRIYALLGLNEWNSYQWSINASVNYTIIGSDNGLSPDQRQAIILTNAGILLIEPLGTKFSQMIIDIHKFSSNNMHLKLLSAKWQPFRLSLNVLSSISIR